MKEVLFVVNPQAGAGRGARVWSALCGRNPALLGATVVCRAVRAEAARAIRDALTPAVKRVVVVGGDGTLHHTLNVMLNGLPDGGRALGLVPAGTGSDLARGLGLEMRPMPALEQALEATPAPLDLLCLQSARQPHYIVNVASWGISVPVAARINALARRTPLTYIDAAVREIVRYRPQWARIVLDGVTWREGHFYLVAVANGRCFANGMLVAPLAVAQDGLADVVVIEDAPRAVILAWLPTVYRGRHLAAAFVHSARARAVTIETGPGRQALEGDGEVTEIASVRLLVMPGAVALSGLAPRPRGSTARDPGTHAPR